MYFVTDNHGTKQVCWSFTHALAWLPFCAESVTVVNRLTRRIVAERHQGV